MQARIVSGDFEMEVGYNPTEPAGTIDLLTQHWQITVRYIWRRRLTSDYLDFIVGEFNPELIRETFSRVAHNSQARRFFDNIQSEIRRMENERRERNPWRSISARDSLLPSSTMIPSSWRIAE